MPCLLRKTRTITTRTVVELLVEDEVGPQPSPDPDREESGVFPASGPGTCRAIAPAPVTSLELYRRRAS